MQLDVGSIIAGKYQLVRPLAQRYDPLALVAWLFIFSLPMVAPLGVIELASAPALDGDDLAFFAFLIAVPTVAAYGLVQIAIRPEDNPPQPGIWIVAERAGQYVEVRAPIEFPDGPAGRKVVGGFTQKGPRPVPDAGL